MFRVYIDGFYLDVSHSRQAGILQKALAIRFKILACAGMNL